MYVCILSVGNGYLILFVMYGCMYTHTLYLYIHTFESIYETLEFE